jgi:hypothetical protein
MFPSHPQLSDSLNKALHTGTSLVGTELRQSEAGFFLEPARVGLVRKLTLGQNRSRGRVFKLQITIDLNRSATKSAYLLAVSFVKTNSIDI